MFDRAKLLFAPAAGAFAGLTLLGYLIWSGYQQAIHSAETTTRNYAAIIEARLDATLRRADAELQQLAHTIPVAALSSNAVSRYSRKLDVDLRGQLINFRELAALQITDASGKVIYMSDSASLGRNLAGRKYFQLLRDNPQSGLVFSETMAATVDGRQRVFAARALRDSGGVFRGVAIAAIELDFFQKWFQSLDMGAGGIVAVYRSDNFTRVVRWPAGDGKLNAQLPPDSPTRAALAPGVRTATVVLSSAADGTARIYSYYVLEHYPYFVSVGIARGDALAEWRTRSLAVGLLGVLLMALLTGMLFRLRRAEVLLAANEERFRAAFEQAGVGMALRAIEPSRPRLLRVNQKLCDMLGYTRDELMQLTTVDLTPPEDRENAIAYNKQLLRGELSNYSREKRYLRKDGQIVWTDLTVSAVCGPDGRPSHVISVIADITERKLAEAARADLEAQLRESQKMEAIGTLAGGVAHDFNNIIAAILGNAELARLDAGGNPRALESLDEIRKAGARARELVQQILSFSRRQPAARQPVGLAPVIDESVRLLRATLPACVVIEVRCEAGVPAVLADATQIEQVLINLATNAMHAMPEGRGHLRIRLDTVVLDGALAEARPALRALHARHPGHAVRLTVSDDGRGMDAATLGRIFEPFFTTKPVGEGTGLGLSVVHGIVQAHEGAITVDSAPGKGATFTLYLPAAPADAPLHDAYTVPAPAALRSAGSSGHILYLDDDGALVFLIERLLKRRGHRVSAHTDQRAALAALKADPGAFDLVVSDYNMPGMSGLDFARQVRAIRPDITIAVVSGFIDETLHAQAEGAGVHELIFKATEVEDYCDTVHRLACTVQGKILS